jgi:hypothetical protein
MTPVPIVEESKSIKFSFSGLSESYRVFAIIEASTPDSIREMRDSSGRSFQIASQCSGWVNRLEITLHRSQQPTGFRTALIHANQSQEEIFVRDYDTAQIYKAHIASIDPKHRTRIKWGSEYFTFALAVVGEGVFNVENESEIQWRNDNSTLVPERGYPY